MRGLICLISASLHLFIYAAASRSLMMSNALKLHIIWIHSSEALVRICHRGAEQLVFVVFFFFFPPCKINSVSWKHIFTLHAKIAECCKVLLQGLGRHYKMYLTCERVKKSNCWVLQISFQKGIRDVLNRDPRPKTCSSVWQPPYKSCLNGVLADGINKIRWFSYV